MASIDEYGLHQYCTGAIGMTLSKDENGLFDGGYDYQTGYARLAGADGSWTECDIATGVQTKGPGKVTAIERCLRPRYEGRGPLAAFGDSSGDFNFMTEFASLKLSEAETLVDSLFDFASLALLLALVLVDSLVDFASLAPLLALVLVDSLFDFSDSDFFAISSESL